MRLAVPIDLPVMEAETRDSVPRGEAWQYEPKWDGFRCLAFRDGEEVELRSKAGKPLARYFPDVVAELRALGARRFVIDGELVVPEGDSLAFDELLLRIHPAASRVRTLAAEKPAMLLAFDLLLAERGGPLTGRPLHERRARLERFAGRYFERDGAIRLSPATDSYEQAGRWLKQGGGLDGVIAKRLDRPYAAGERSAMVKVKNLRSADCVVGGFRRASGGRGVGSLLLGLFDGEGLLHHVGHTSGLSDAERAALVSELEPLRGGPGFTGRAPGGPSRWSTERSAEWEPLEPSLVVEVRYDHFSGGRFRHGTRLLRRRPDKRPDQCRLEQVEQRSRPSLKLLG